MAESFYSFTITIFHFRVPLGVTSARLSSSSGDLEVDLPFRLDDSALQSNGDSTGSKFLHLETTSLLDREGKEEYALRIELR